MDFKKLSFLKMCPIFETSVDNFGKRNEKIKVHITFDHLSKFKSGTDSNCRAYNDRLLSIPE